MRRLLLALLLGAAPEGDTLIALDVKEGPVENIVQALAEAGGFQVVFDPGLSCRLTLRLNGVSYSRALESVLRACGLALEAEGNVLRVAKTPRLAQEAAERRRLQEAQAASAPRREVRLRLSYAKAAQMAPLVKRFL
jgi:type IV pilus assembly protein PilQ